MEMLFWDTLYNAGICLGVYLFCHWMLFTFESSYLTFCLSNTLDAYMIWKKFVFLPIIQWRSSNVALNIEICFPLYPFFTSQLQFSFSSTLQRYRNVFIGWYLVEYFLNVFQSRKSVIKSSHEWHPNSCVNWWVPIESYKNPLNVSANRSVWCRNSSRCGKTRTSINQNQSSFCEEMTSI